MKNPKCGACINKITLLGSLKNLSFTTIVCPFCNHKNKVKTKYIALYASLGFVMGFVSAYLIGSGGFIPAIALLLITGIIFTKTWAECFEI